MNTRGRAELAWFERHDPEIRELPWVSVGVVGVAPASTVESASAAEDVPAVVSVDREELDAAQTRLVEVTATLAQTQCDLSTARTEAEGLRLEIADARAAALVLATRMRDDAERELVTLAVAVAGRVVARELTAAPDLIVAWVREAVAGSDLGGSFVVATSADLSAAVPDAAWGELEDALRMDPALPAGTCEVRNDSRTVTVSAEERLDVVAEHLASVPATRAA